MEQKVFSIYDSKAEVYGNPWMSVTTGSGIREFDKIVNNAREGNMFFDYPADYTLFEIGIWHDDRGVMEMYEAKKNLGSGNEFLAAQNVGNIQESIGEE